jgi:hypothetical protein
VRTTTLTAERKWCPFARALPRTLYPSENDDDERVPAAVNRDLYDDAFDRQATCIGYCCMMWRYSSPNARDMDENAEGYCGLAGRPLP